MGAIYRITHRVSGTTYVGSTNNVKRRWWGHKSRLQHGAHHNPHFQAAWDKYGEAAFEWVVLEQAVEDTDLIEREQSWLDEYKERGEVYNAGDCAEAPRRGQPSWSKGKQLSGRHRRKIGVAMLGNQHWLGRKHAEESKYKMSEAKIGHEVSEEAKRKMGEAKARPYPVFIHRETGEVIPAGVNLKAMCEERGLDQSHMCAIIHGQQQSHRGWTLL